MSASPEPNRAALFYVASPTKRPRATKTEVEERRAHLYEIVQAMRPMTVRQVFYQASVRDIVEKSEAGYNKVQTDLVLMRKAGFRHRSVMMMGPVRGTLNELLRLPYGWLAVSRKPSPSPIEKLPLNSNATLTETGHRTQTGAISARLWWSR